MNFWPIFLIFSGGVILTVGDVVMKKWVGGGGRIYYIIGLVVYLVALNFLAQSYKFRNIAGASTTMTVINAILLIIVSYIYFKEPLNPLQIIGIALGFTAIIFLELPSYL